MKLKRKIFNIFAAAVMVFGSMPITFFNTYAADEEQGIVPAERDIPKSLKSVKANKNADGVPDGTYDITLEIEGVSRNQNEATKANVIVVYDSSGSMGNTARTYEYNSSTNGQYGLVSGDYLVLHRWRTGSFGRRYCTEVGDNYSGTVYSDDDCSVTYSGTRYSRTAVDHGTRIQVAKDAVNGLANKLLSQNDPNNPDFKDVVEMAFVDFDTNVKTNTTHTTPTTDLDTFKRWVTAAGAGGGTNWEDALTTANSIDFGDNDKTYIIFVSDGDPTYRNSKYADNANDCSQYDGWGWDAPCIRWGEGDSDDNGWNLGAAVVAAGQITSNTNKEFYTVGAFGDVSNMEELGGTYKDAADQDELERAFAEIVEKIKMGLSVADLQIEDGITSATSTEIDGAAGNFRYSVPDAWGTDYAKATFEGGAVHWNPGLDKTLSNGEKASVTFTVWPSQEAMDCIASLRNDGVCDEENLTKFGLGENADGSFRLITNSTATFRFKTATKVEGSDEPTYSDISIPIQFEEDRDPTNLPETELEVTKLWEDSMDPAQRDDIKEVILKLKVDDDEVRTFVFNKQDESGSEWVNSYTYAVAPGVMKELDGTAETEGLRSIAKSIVTMSGVEYAVLEEGHDYLFDESYTLEDEENGTNHYHITKRLYHPMIVNDGSIHDVIFNDDGTVEIEEIELTKLSAENTLNGGISVRKKVINNDVEDTEIAETYPITVTLNGADAGKYRIYTYNPDGSLKSRTEKMDYTGGKIEAEITVNQEIRVLDVPTGVTFEVAEALPSGYTRNEVDYEVIKYDGTDNEEINEVFGNASSTALVTNYLESGDLTIKKTVTASSGDLTEAQKKLFGFTVYFYEHEGDTNPVRVDDSTCSMKGDVDNRISHNGTCTIENIPTGWYYEIVETTVPGFNKGAQKTETGTIKKGNNEETFINDYSVAPLDPEDAKILVNKAFASGYEPFWIALDQFIFVMTGNGETVESKPLTLSGSSAEFTPVISDAGTYTYTITEKTTDADGNSLFRDGVSRLANDEDIVVTIVVEDKGDGTLGLVSKTYANNSKNTIYNIYEGDNTYGGKEGELEFTKSLTGRDWRSTDKFDFTISSQDEGAPMPKETTISADKDHKTVGFGKIKFTNKDIGNTYTYTVTESFDVPSVEATGTSAGGISLTVEVKFNDQTGKIDLVVSDYEDTFTNEYKTTNVTAAKVWDDDEDRDGLRENYEGYYVAVKNDEGKYVAYEALALTDKDDYTFADLPEKNADGEVIDYEIVEASTCSGTGESIRCTEFKKDNYYTATVENGVITNFHEPALYNTTGDLTVKKIWAGDGNDLVRPGSVTVELLANGEVIDTADIVAGQNDEWTFTFNDLYLNEGGEPIVYSVQESAIGETAFGKDESVIVVLSDEGAIEGSWTKSVDNDKFEVTNTWSEAEDEIVYEGDTQFTIEKVDEDYKPLSDVVFAVEGHSDKTTDKNGEITITVPISDDKKEESFEYKISEKEAKEGYDTVEDSATVTISCISELAGKDTDRLVNTYTKTCVFNEEGDKAFSWDEEELTLTVVNNRSLAKSFVIQKTVKGLSPEVLTDLEFTIEGPEDFGEDGKMTLKASDDCVISGELITCKVQGKVPTGKYKVLESNADVEYFELSVSGDISEEKDVVKDERAVFEITNEYEVERIMYYVDKIWEDAHDKDGKRPDKLTVNLFANGEIIETIDLTMRDAYIIDENDEDYVTGDIWGYVWEGLPYVDEYAEVITYTAEEVLESGDYEQLEVFDDEYWTTFVNYHELDDPCANGGCGGIVPPIAPETGKFTSGHGGGDATVENSLVVAMSLGMTTLIVLPLLGVAVVRRRR